MWPYLLHTLRHPVRWSLLPPATKLGQGYVFTRVCDSVHMWGLPQCMLGYPATPQQGDPPSKETPWQGDPPGKETPPARIPPLQGDPPCAVHARRYGQQAGGMHPTGIQFLLQKRCRQIDKYPKSSTFHEVQNCLEYIFMDLGGFQVDENPVLVV